jgi:hypothetical protein
MLFQTFYHSKSIFPRGHITDLEILRIAQETNRHLRLTGFLVRANGCFFQYLEGGVHEMLEVLESIRLDTRHFDMNEISVMRDEPRQFPGWSMGYADVPPDEVRTLEQMLQNCHGNLSEIVRQVSDIAQQHGATPLEE